MSNKEICQVIETKINNIKAENLWLESKPSCHQNHSLIQANKESIERLRKELAKYAQ
jgi:hypothetical protein